MASTIHVDIVSAEGEIFSGEASMIFAPAVMGLVADTGAGTSDGIRNALLLAGVIVILGALAGFFLIDPEADRPAHSPDPRLGSRPA